MGQLIVRDEGGERREEGGGRRGEGGGEGNEEININDRWSAAGHNVTN